MAWTDSIVVGNGDVALVIEPEGRELSGQCRAGADEAAADASGWASFFAPMSHLCVFSSQLVGGLGQWSRRREGAAHK